jgi:hypothetical protein
VSAGWLAALLLAASPTDKAALFGDPSLVPTRAGERAREELALAAAVAGVVGARAGKPPVVEVRLPRGADGGAVVIAGAVAMTPEAAVRAAEAVVGPWSAGRVQVFAGEDAGAAALDPVAADDPVVADPVAGVDPVVAGGRGGPSWALAVALALFGASAGITVDRLLRRRASLYATRR